MSKSKQLMIAAGSVVVFLMVLAVTNPGPGRHNSAVSHEMNKDVPGVGKLLGAMTGVASNYNNYGLFSTTTIGDDRMTFGVLGMVFVADRE